MQQRTRWPAQSALQHRLSLQLSIRAQHHIGADNVLANFLCQPELHRHNRVAQWRN